LARLSKQLKLSQRYEKYMIISDEDLESLLAVRRYFFIALKKARFLSALILDF